MKSKEIKSKEAPIQAEENRQLDIVWPYAWLALAIIVLAGLLMRLYRLEYSSLWEDEALQINGISLPFSELRTKHLLTTEQHPPLSYWIERIFWLPFKTVYSARFPSVLFGVFMIPVAYWTGRRMLNRFAGLIASFFTAFSFLLLWYSQECRLYIFFGFAIWLIMAIWCEIFLTPLSQRIPVSKWVFMALTGVLCGLLHFSTLYFLPILGLVTVAAILTSDKQGLQNRKLVIRRLWGTFLSLFASWLVCLLIFGYFIDIGLFMRVGTGHYRPTIERAWTILLKYSWGKGWRLLPFGALLLCAFLPASRAQQRLSVLFAAFALVTLGVGFYVYPILNEGTFNYAFRYFFWVEWCVVMLLTFGAYRLCTRCTGWRVRLIVLALMILAYTGIHWSIYLNFYRKQAKTGNYVGLQRQAEQMQGRHLLVLANGYDMQYIQHYWPSNCTFASAPIFNNAEEFNAMGIKHWLMNVLRAYPNIMLEFCGTDSFVGIPLPEFSRILTRHVLVTNGTEMALFQMGVHPGEAHLSLPYGVPLTLLFNLPQDLMALATRTGRPLILFSDTPLLTTMDANAHYRLWRLLDRAIEFQILNPDATNRIESLDLSVASLSQEGRVALGKAGQMLGQWRVPARVTRFYDQGQRRWLTQPLSIRDVLSVSYRVPLGIDTISLVQPVTLVPGTNTLTLVPEGAAMLVGEPPPRFTLSEAPL
jgi:uncharacterized membrane protein